MISPPCATRRGLPLWAAVLLAAAAGPILDAGFPDRGWWPLTFLGIGMMLVALRGRGAGGAFLVGGVGGLSYYLIYVQWTALYLGPVPWIALSALEALFFGLGCVLIALAYRWVPAAWPTLWGRTALTAAVVAGLWTLREAITNVWPYGGFAWGRMSLSQSESPFTPLVTWVGLSGLSFLMVFLVALLVQLAAEHTASRVGRATVAVAALAVLVVIPGWPVAVSGSTTVAAVQGNAKAGYFDKREQGDILRDQTRATLPLIGQDLDMVVWPENGSDLDPTRSAAAAATLDALSKAVDAPLVVGTITEREGLVYNSSLVWQAGEPVSDIYDKKHPVPFGEYVPDRAFWTPFAPGLLGMIGRDYTPGTRDGVVDINGVIAGLAICFDISDDQLITEVVRAGAEMIIAQTNNADFGRTDESVQQLAIARMKAIESSRSLVNISTVGTSQIIAPDGVTLAQVPAFQPGTMVAEVPLSTNITPAIAFGRTIEVAISAFAVIALVGAGLLSRTSRRRYAS